jgi:hypothetical protein
MDPMKMARENAYMRSHQIKKDQKALLQQVQEKLEGKRLNFNGSEEVKPLKWIGTQRSQYTHRLR